MALFKKHPDDDWLINLDQYRSPGAVEKWKKNNLTCNINEIKDKFKNSFIKL